MTPASPPLPLRRAAAWGLVVLMAFSIVVRSARHDVYTQDTTAVIDGVHRSVTCLRDGVVRACRFHPETQSSDVNPYPLLQYLPAAALAAAGLGDDGIRSGLIWANTLAVAATAVLVVGRARVAGGAGHAVVAGVAVGSGMLLPYAGHSFGEPLAVLAEAVLIVQLLVPDRPDARATRLVTAAPALAASAFLAAVAKETLVLSLACFAAAALVVARHDRAVIRRRAAAVAVGSVVGVVANMAFNVFRFGGLRNVQYFRETRPGPARAVVNAVSLLVAPNGGLVWFWLAAAAALAVLGAMVCWPGRLAGRERLAAGAALAGFGIGLVSLGLWWGPFGWYSWGPRLLLPFLVPPLVVALELAAPGRWLAGPVLRRRGLVLLAVPVLALAVPALGDIWNREAWNSMQLATAADHPECATVAIDRGQPYAPFHRCLMDAAWRLDHGPLLDTLTTMPGSEAPWFWATVAAGLAAAVLWLMDTRPAPRPPPSAAADG